MSLRMVSIVLAFLLILSACSSETVQNDLDQALFSDSELECEFYAKCGFFYDPSKLRIDYGSLLHRNFAKPTIDKSGLVYQWEQTSGPITTNIKFDSQTGVISWHSNTDPGEYGFKVSAYDMVSDQVKAYNHQADFTLIVSVKPISEFFYPQTNRVLFYKNSGRSQKPRFSQKPRLNLGLGPLVYRLTTKDGGNLDGVSVLDNGQIEWKDFIQVGTNELVVIASNFVGSKTTRYRLVVSNQLDADGLGVFLNTKNVIATYGTSLSTNLLRIEGLADGVGIADAFSLELTDKDGGAIPSEINLSPEGRLEIGHDSRSYLQVGSESDYLLKLEGKAYNYDEENKKNKEFSIEMLAKPVTNLGGGGSDGITYGGPIVTTENVATVKNLILPDDFLVRSDTGRSDTWPEAVDFSILRENEMFAPENIEIDAWGKISLSKEVAVDDSGNYLVRVEGKGNYGGSVDIPVGVVVHRKEKTGPLNPLVKIDFYGKKISGISKSDRQMGLGDLLWKTNWITIKPSGLDSSKNYQVVLRDDRGGKVRSLDLGNSGKEIRVGAGDFDLEAKKKLILLNEGKITVDLLSEGVSVPPGEKIRFTKAFKKIRNWRDLQAIGVAGKTISAILDGDYQLINSITLPAAGSDGELAGIDHAGNPHTMTDKGFDPIGDPTTTPPTPFKGSFDGNGYQISGLWINRDQEDNVGLFGRIEGSGNSHVGVRDLTLELSPYNNNNIAIVGNDNTGALAGSIKQTKVSGVKVLGAGQVKGNDYVGGLIGQAENSIVENSDTEVSVKDSKNRVGGLVGFNDDSSEIKNSYATGDVTGSGDWVGGLVGWNDDSSEISRSYAIGEVSGNNNVGGLVGWNGVGSLVSRSYAIGEVSGNNNVGGLVGDNNLSFISNSYATGNVTGSGDEVGGLVGRFWRGTIKNTYSTGEVSGNTLVGGLVGRFYHSIYMGSSYWDKKTSKQDNSPGGGTGKFTKDMKKRRTFASGGWDFNNIWAIDPNKNHGYPYLKDLAPVDLAPANAAPSVGGTSGGNHKRDISSLGFNYQPIAGIAGVGDEGAPPKVEGLVGNYSLSEIASFRILTNKVEPSHLRMNDRGRVELKKGITPEDSGTYQVEITGKGTYQGVASVDVKVEINPPPRLSDNAQVSYLIVRTNGEATKEYPVSGSVGVPEGDRTYYKKSDEDWWGIDLDTGMIEVEDTISVSSGDHEIKVGLAVAGYTGKVTNQVTVRMLKPLPLGGPGGISYGGAIVATQWVVTERVLNPPNGFFLLGSDTWKDAVNFSITRVGGADVPRSVTVDHLGTGTVRISDQAVVADSGDYLVRMVGKDRYTGTRDIKVRVEVRLNAKISFYGKDGGSSSDRQMGLGDLLWKEKWVTIKVPTDGNYQLTLIDSDGAEIRTHSTGGKQAGKEVSFGVAEFNWGMWGLLDLKEGPMTARLEKVVGGSAYGVIDLPFTKALKEVRNWRDLQAIGFAPALANDYTLMNNIILPEPESDGGLAGINSDRTSHKMDAKGFDPIGDKDHPFTGTFYGNGHQIRGLSIKRDDWDNVGLFGRIKGDGKDSHLGVRDLTLKLSSYDDTTDIAISGQGKTGALAGTIERTKVSGVKVLGAGLQVKGDSAVGGLIGFVVNSVVENSDGGVMVGGGNDVGGLVGKSDNSKVISSYSTGAVTGSGIIYVGGLMGNNYQSEIISSYATGNVRGTEGVGGLVGISHEGSSVEGSYSTGAVTGSGNNVGGLVGWNADSSTISNSYATGNVTGSSLTGGLVGQNKGNSEVIGSYATGDVTGSGNCCVGGLVGDNLNSEIKDSYAKGNVEGQGVVGGLVGANNGGTIINTYSIGAVSGNTFVGGLVGQALDNPTVISSYWDKDTSGRANSPGGGMGKSTSKMKQESTFTSWDFGFGTIWAIDPSLSGTINDGYPFLNYLRQLGFRHHLGD